MWSLFLGLPKQSVVEIDKMVGMSNFNHTAVLFRNLNYVIVKGPDGMKVLDVTLQKW